MDLKTQTIDTYNESAEALAKKFNDQGARTEDIEFVFSKYEKQNPFVVEIGCGNGRDAEEILKHTNNYLGIDVSFGLLQIAKQQVPQAQFKQADIEALQFPPSVDIIFAFASLIHVNKESFKAILGRIHSSLSQNGLVFISLKHSDSYIQVTKDDEFGTRTYWHYSEQDIREIAPDFSFEYVNIHEIRGQVWMEILLKKR